VATFDITRPSGTIRLDEDRRAPVPFTVTNLTSAPIRARLDVIPQTAADRPLFTVEGGAERTLQPNETLAIRVLISATSATAPGSHGFVLKVVDIERPDDVFATSQPVEFVIAPAPARTWPFWWVIPVAALVLIAAVTTIWWRSRHSGELQLDYGYRSAAFVNVRNSGIAAVDDPRILVYGRAITSMRFLMPLLEQLVANGKPPLVIVAHVEDAAVAELARATAGAPQRSGAPLVPPVLLYVVVDVSPENEETLERVAAFTQTHVLVDERELENARLDDLGRAKQVRVGKSETSIVGFGDR
jgi:hypothetical protein